MKISEPVLFDTNILVFAHDTFSPNHQAAKKLLNSSIAQEMAPVLSTQNILEFYSIITNPKRSQSPLAIVQAQFLVNQYLSSGVFTIIHPLAETIFRTFRLVKNYKIRRDIVFDTYLVATMLDHEIKTIYTDNEKHFKIFPEVKVINPFK